MSIKKLAGETAIYGLSSILGRVVSWVALTPYLTRVFVREEYGVVNELYFWVALLLVVFTYRMETAFFRFGSKAQRQDGSYDRYFSTATLSVSTVTLLLTTVLFLLAPVIAEWLDYPDRVQYVRLFASIVALDALAAIPFARLRLDGRPLHFASIRIIGILLNVGLVFFFLEGCPWLIERGYSWPQLIYSADNRIAYVFWANLLSSAVILLLLLPLYRGLRLQLSAPALQQMIRYALPLVLAGVAGIINSLIGIPLLKSIGGGTTTQNLALAGVYAAASKLAVLMNLFIQAYNYAAEPFFFRQAAASEDRHIYAQAARAFALAGALAFLGIMLYLDVIQLFIGSDFREGLGVLPILLVANFFLGLYYNFSISYKLTDQTRLGGYIALGGMTITLVLNYVLIPLPQVSYYGPAWAALACYGFMALTSWAVGQRLFPVRYRLDKMGLYLLLALAGYGLSYWLDRAWPMGLWSRMVVHTVILLAYLAVLLAMEWPWVSRILRRRQSSV